MWNFQNTSLPIRVEASVVVSRLLRRRFRLPEPEVGDLPEAEVGDFSSNFEGDTLDLLVTLEPEIPDSDAVEVGAAKWC